MCDEFAARRVGNQTEATDDATSLRDWLLSIAWVVATMRENPDQVRRWLVKLATLALAAAEAHNRRAGTAPPPAQSGGTS